MYLKGKILGFTLLELLIVIAIIGVLTSISFVALNGARTQGRDGRRKSDLETIRSALELYKADCNRYPNSLPTVASAGSLNGNSAPCTVGAANVYLRKMPGDPSTNADYGYQVGAGNTTYTLCATLEDTSSDTCTLGSHNYGVANP